MIKTLLFALLFLVLTVPWWFTGGDSPGLFGLPGWAVFAVAMSFAYACAVSWHLRAQWKRDEGEEEPGDDEAAA